MSQSMRKRNLLRRALLIGVCLSPIALLAASVAVCVPFPRKSPWGLGLMACALLVGCLNFYLGAFRRPLYRWRHGTMEGCPNVSGIPLIGTLFVVIGGIVGFGDWRAAVLGLVVLALDLTGLPWLAICLWSEPSLLDSE